MNVAELVEKHTGHRPESVVRVQTAAAHNVWRCDDYFVKVGTRDNFFVEAEAHAIAREAGVPVPDVVAFGDSFLISRGIAGRPSTDARDGLRHAITEAARLIRPLHAVSRPGFGWPSGNELAGERATWYEHLSAELEWGLVALDDLIDGDVVRDTLERHRGTIEALTRGSVLHGDFSAVHVFVEDGRVTAIIDWADAMVGDPVWEIGVFTSWMPDVVDVFLQGYEPDASERERITELLPVYRALRHVWGYRAGIEDGWDESQRLEVLRRVIVELRREA